MKYIPPAPCTASFLFSCSPPLPEAAPFIIFDITLRALCFRTIRSIHSYPDSVDASPAINHCLYSATQNGAKAEQSARRHFAMFHFPLKTIYQMDCFEYFIYDVLNDLRVLLDKTRYKHLHMLAMQFILDITF